MVNIFLIFSSNYTCQNVGK